MNGTVQVCLMYCIVGSDIILMYRSMSVQVSYMSVSPLSSGAAPGHRCHDEQEGRTGRTERVCWAWISLYTLIAKAAMHTVSFEPIIWKSMLI